MDSLREFPEFQLAAIIFFRMAFGFSGGSAGPPEAKEAGQPFVPPHAGKRPRASVRARGGNPLSDGMPTSSDFQRKPFDAVARLSMSTGGPVDLHGSRTWSRSSGKDTSLPCASA
jgi:hypothetical protein